MSATSAPSRATRWRWRRAASCRSWPRTSRRRRPTRSRTRAARSVWRGGRNTPPPSPERRKHHEDRLGGAHRRRRDRRRRLRRRRLQRRLERTGEAAEQAAGAGEARGGRGRTRHHRLGRGRRGRLDRSEGRLGDAVRAEDRLPGQRQGRQHQRRDGHADAHRPLRRRVRVGRRDAAPDRRRRRRAGQHRPGAQLRRRLPRTEEPAVQLGRRPDVRDPARPRREHPHVALGQDLDAAGLVGGGVRPGLPVQGQGHGLRQPDLHRRRRAVPEGDQAGPEDRQPLRARSEAVRRERRAAQAAAREHRRVLVGLHEGAVGVRQRRLDRRDDLAGDREPARGRQGADQDDAAQGGRHRLVGHLDDLLQGQASQLHVHVDGLDHLAEGQRPGGGVVRRGAVQREGVRGDGEQGPLRDLPRRRPGVLRQGLVLDDAAQAVRRRPRERLQGLLRLGPGLDRDQGLIGHRDAERGEEVRRPPPRPPGLPGEPAAGRAAGLARRRLPRLARGPVHRRVLVAGRLQRPGRPQLQPGQLPHAVGGQGLPRDRAAHGRRGRRGDGHRRDPRVPDRVLHGQGGGAAHAQRARGGGADAAVGELPREGLRVAHDPQRGRDLQLGAAAVRPARARLRDRRHVAGLQLPLAAVHDPAGLRRAGADPGLDDRGVRRPRRKAVDDVPPGRPAARVPGHGRRLDLHVLTHARRLHRAAAGELQAVHRQRRLRERRRRQQPPAGRRVRDRAGARDDPLPPGRAPAGRVRAALMRALLRLATGLTLAFLYAPLIVILVYAFNARRTATWPPPGFTLDWWTRAFHNHGVRSALWTSIQAGLGATAIALLLGTLAAFAVARYRFFGRESISFLVVLPIALPGIVTGMALNSTFTQVLGVDLTLFTIIVGHATFCIVVVYNNVIARLRRLGGSLEEASADLGAHTWQTFRYVTFPQMRSALIAGGLLAFALSFDEVIVTTFTAGNKETLPIWILANLSRPNQLPVVNVVGVVVILLSVVPVYFAVRIASESVSAAPR